MTATKRRRLTDLYVTGKMVTFNDGVGDPVEIWVQKMNPTEQELVIRRANAARAKILAAQRDPEGEIYASAETEVSDFMRNRDSIVEYLAGERESEIIAATEAELAAEDEWSKDGYLQGLRDVWEERLSEEYSKDPENEEAKRVFSELERFSERVGELTKGAIQDTRDSYADLSDEVLLEKAVAKYLQVQADIGWMAEYRKAELWVSLRDPDNHRQRYFESREELDELQTPVLNRLLEELSNLTIDPEEGKD